METCVRLLLVSLLLLTSATSCRRSAVTRPVATPVDANGSATQPATLDDWVGVYCSPNEVGGFSGTVLVVEKHYSGRDLWFDMRFTSDVMSANSIRQPETSGTCLAEGDRLFVPNPYGYYHDGKPVLAAGITRYTRKLVNDRVVLMRDDALKAFVENDKLYDYGILIQTGRELAAGQALREVPHPSIKLLYRDPTKPWKDPFVAGPNER